MVNIGKKKIEIFKKFFLGLNCSVLERSFARNRSWIAAETTGIILGDLNSFSDCPPTRKYSDGVGDTSGFHAPFAVTNLNDVP